MITLIRGKGRLGLLGDKEEGGLIR